VCTHLDASESYSSDWGYVYVYLQVYVYLSTYACVHAQAFVECVCAYTNRYTWGGELAIYDDIVMHECMQ